MRDGRWFRGGATIVACGLMCLALVGCTICARPHGDLGYYGGNHPPREPGGARAGSLFGPQVTATEEVMSEEVNSEDDIYYEQAYYDSP